jgi:hypothetical protein
MTRMRLDESSWSKSMLRILVATTQHLERIMESGKVRWKRLDLHVDSRP